MENFLNLWAIEPQLANQKPIDARRAAMKATADGQPKALAVIEILGEMSKEGSDWGTSTMGVRAALREAAANPDIGSILLRIDSPGGTVAGTYELAADVAAVNQLKPVVAYIEDTGASAAYWVASAARKVYANELALVGSIGVVATVADTSKLAENAGVKFHTVSTGKFKGAFGPGQEVTEEQIAYLQGIIDQTGEFFKKAVQTGRGMTAKEVEAVADGRVMHAKEAKAAGLIDGIKTFDEVLAMSGASRIARRSRAEMEIELEG